MTGSKVKKFFWYQFPLILWLCAIFIQSSIPSLSAPDFGFELQDKVAHAIEYAILAVLLMRSLSHFENKYVREKAALLTFLIGSFYAVFDEVHQFFVPGRHADAFDVMADIIGVGLVVIFYSIHQKSKFKFE